MSNSPVMDNSIPSTPQSFDDEYQGVQHLAQHNSAMAYPLRGEAGMHYYGPTPSIYGSPTSNHWQADPYLIDSQGEFYRQQIDGSEGRYGLPADVEIFHPQPYPQVHPYQRLGAGYHRYLGMPDRNLEDPYAHNNNNNSNNVQVARNRQKAEGKARHTGGTKPRRTKAIKADKSKVPRINAPLSQLTKDMEVPVRDMEAWVTRPAEARHKETEKRNGYVTRPMNSFMLYRSAYAERTKQWCLQNNHQVVSSVSGESWPMEPVEIRDRYNEYARLERENHQKAHPGYKFSPSKASNSIRKRKGVGLESDDDGTEQDASDYDWLPSGSRKLTSRQAVKRLDRGGNYSGLVVDDGGYNAMLNRSAFQNSNPGRPLPAPVVDLDSFEDHGQYYAQPLRNSVQGPNYIEDVGMRKIPVPAGHLRAPSGLPGANHDDLFSLDDGLQHEYHGDSSLSHLDPSLIELENPYAGGMFTDQAFDDFNTDALIQENKHEIREVTPMLEEDVWGPLNTAGDDAFKTWVNESNEH